ncbi:ABC transporter transmembrane domain-containing protein [Plesiomonas shigelloides subsp. oncorhynchi]|nr:ABC transporter transmembrane domain-containing protein [Plesiomonas shigelloides]
MLNDKDLTTWQTFRRLWPMIKPFRLGLIVAAIALVINAGTDTAMISLLKPLLDDGFGNADTSFLRVMPFALFGLMLLRGVTNFVSNSRLVMGIRQSGDAYASAPVQAHDAHAGVLFDKQSTGTLLSRITYDSEQVASSSSGALITVVREGAYIIGLLGMMFYNSWQLSLILVVVGPVVALAIRVVSVVSAPLAKICKTPWAM